MAGDRGHPAKNETVKQRAGWRGSQGIQHRRTRRKHELGQDQKMCTVQPGEPSMERVNSRDPITIIIVVLPPVDTAVMSRAGERAGG